MLKQTKDKDSEIFSKIATGLSDLKEGEIVAPTNLANKISIHQTTLINKLNEYDLIKSVGYRLLKDTKKRIKAIIRNDEDLNTRKELRDIRRECLEIKNTLDEIKLLIKR